MTLAQPKGVDELYKILFIAHDDERMKRICEIIMGMGIEIEPYFCTDVCMLKSEEICSRQYECIALTGNIVYNRGESGDEHQLTPLWNVQDIEESLRPLAKLSDISLTFVAVDRQYANNTPLMTTPGLSALCHRRVENYINDYYGYRDSTEEEAAKAIMFLLGINPNKGGTPVEKKNWDA